MPGNSNCFINIALKAVRGAGERPVNACLCVCFVWYMYGQIVHQQLSSVTVRHTWTPNSCWHWSDLSSKSACFSPCCLCHHQVALIKKLMLLPEFLLLVSLSFDVLLIWQLKVSFVASTSAFILLSAPSAQWCKSHMLLFHMTVLILLLWWHHLLSSDHSLDEDRIRCHLPPSRSTSHCVHSFKGARNCWIHKSKNHVSFHYQYWWVRCLSYRTVFLTIQGAYSTKQTLPLLPLKGCVCVYIPN